MEDALKLSIVDPNNIEAPSLTLLKSFIKSCVPQTTPPTVSLDPFINFVKLCAIISAPNFAGEIDNGENVLSTTNFKLCFLAIADNPFISATSKSGLLTDSQVPSPQT